MFSCKGRRREKIRQTLGFLIKNGKIKLGVKVGGKDFGRGRLNGFGGDVEPGQTIEEAARREIKEETGGLEVVAMEKRGVINFFFENEPDRVREVHVFWVSEWSGEATGSQEMTVQGFFLEEIESLYSRMWAGDRLWLPMFLEGKKFQGWIFYDSPQNNQIVSHLFWEVEEL